MPAGKGRIVLRSRFSLVVSYEYEASRRPGILEGCFFGRLFRLERSAFFDDIELVCQDDRIIDLTVTTYSARCASFTGAIRLPGAAQEVDTTGQEDLFPRAVA